MTDQAKPAPSYDDLKESVFPTQNKPSSIDLASLANTVFAVKKWTDIATAATLSLLVLSGGTATVLAPLLIPAPLASATLGITSTIIAGKRAATTGTARSSDSPEVSGFRKAFRAAASALQNKQLVSSALLVASPFMMGLGIMGMFSSGSDIGGASMWALFPLSAVVAIGGAVLGHAAKNDNTKMNVYEAVIGREQQKPATPATNP
jgi:hypothetical protein